MCGGGSFCLPRIAPRLRIRQRACEPRSCRRGAGRGFAQLRVASALHYLCAMNIKAIVASLVLGSSSLAIAAPGPAPAAACTPVAQPVRRVGPPVHRPVTLASGRRFVNPGRAVIAVGSQAGRFGSLQLTAASGRTFIRQLDVQFDNGQHQVVREINRTLIGDQRVTVDLDGNRRAIRRIVVYGSDVYGQPGAFTVTGLRG
jgi:hypothetical protein